LGPNQTPVTLESFQLWKKNRVDKKTAEDSAARKSKENRMKAGRSQGILLHKIMMMRKMPLISLLLIVQKLKGNVNV
jgi:hypothetical protein